MTAIRILIVQACLISLMYGVTEGCSCFPSHPQNQVCSARFIFVAKILSRENETSSGPFPDVIYSTKVIIPVKNSPSHGSIFNFTTANNGAACGVFYPIGSIQLLVGHGNRIGLCSGLFAKTLPQLSYIFSTQRRSSYLKNCGCKLHGVVQNSHRSGLTVDLTVRRHYICRQQSAVIVKQSLDHADKCYDKIRIDDGSVFPKPPARESCTPPTDTTAKACYVNQGLCVKVGRGFWSRCIWKNVNGC